MYCSLLRAFILINGTSVPPCQPRIKILRSHWVSTQGVRASYWKSHHHFLDISSWAFHHGASSALLYANTSRIYVQDVRLDLPLTLLLIFNFSLQINSQFSCIFVYLKTGLGFSLLMVVEYFKLETDKDHPNLYNSPNWLWEGYGSNQDKYKTIKVTCKTLEKTHQAPATITNKHRHLEGSSGT